MFAADAELDIGPGGAAAGAGDFDQFADAVLIQADKQVVLENPLVLIGFDKGADVVAADARWSGSDHWCRN